MKREMNLNQPIWEGDRSNPKIGIARFRILDKKGQIAGNNAKIRVFINYKETDHSSPIGWKLLYPYPFDMKCSEVAKYPTQVLNDYHRTVVHIVPLAHMYENKKHRERTMPREEYQDLAKKADLTPNESALMASLAMKKEQEIKAHNDFENGEN